MVIWFWRVVLLLFARRIEYAGKVNWFTYYVIYRPIVNWNYDQFAARMGPFFFLKKTRIISFDRYRGSGTSVQTEAGTFSFMNYAQPYNFNGQPLNKIWYW